MSNQNVGKSAFTVAFCLLSLLLSVSAFAQGRQPEFVKGEVLIRLKSDLSENSKVNTFQKVGQVGWVSGYSSKISAYRVQLHNNVSVEQALDSLRNQSEVLYAEPNYIRRTSATPNDIYFTSKQWAPQMVQATKAWDIWSPKKQIIIAIVDTGVQTTHPDLTNKILRDNSGNVIGYNAITNGTNVNDGAGHGTHCAGIAAAQVNNGTGIAGIAGWNGVAGSSDTTWIKIMPVKVLDDTGSGTDSDVAEGIMWAADHGANIISLSLGGAGSSATLNNAVQYAWGKGCIICAAAGNDGTAAKGYPAAYANVLSVAATTTSDTLASFSNYGSWVLIAAPGVSIYSTVPTNSYASYSGTSMATPLVSGVAALLMSHSPTLTNAQVFSRLISTSDTINANLASGSGRVNAYRALNNGTASPPAAPTGLTATAGDKKVTLSWTASTGATSYNVKRSTTDGSGYVQIATNVTPISYVDSTVANGTTYFYVISAVNANGESANSSQAFATPQSATAGTTIRINAGGGSMSISLGFFGADNDFSGGASTYYGNFPIAGTTDDALYQDAHLGTSFSYSIPVKNGNYTVRLHFAELNYNKKGQRKFNVSINNSTVLSNLDVFALVGMDKAYMTTHSVTVTNGQINLKFVTGISNSNAMVSGIEIIPR